MSHNFFLFPHMELRLMFHTLWTNSSCHGYHSLEFPVSWVIKFPTLILLYWFVSVTPYFLGLLSLREQSKTFHRLLVSSQAFVFCTPVWGKNWGCFFRRCIKQQESLQDWSDAQHPRGHVSPGLSSGCPSLKASATGNPAAVLGSPPQHFDSFSIRVFLPTVLSPMLQCEHTSSCPVCGRYEGQLYLFSAGA